MQQKKEPWRAAFFLIFCMAKKGKGVSKNERKRGKDSENDGKKGEGVATANAKQKQLCSVFTFLVFSHLKVASWLGD